MASAILKFSRASKFCIHNFGSCWKRTLYSSQQVAEFYNEDHFQMKSSVRKIIDNDINPNVDKWENEGDFPAHQVFKTLGNAGLLGITKDKEYGGLGLDYTYQMAFLEEMGHINCAGVTTSIGVQTDMSTPALSRFGSDELKKKFLLPSITGDMVSCIGVSEVTGGSDVSAIKTTAVRKGDDFVINGQKMWITNAFQADWICLLANTSQGPAHKNKSLICVPMDTKGITLTKRIDKMGLRSSDTGQIFFEDVRVPASNIIGEEGFGFTYQMMQFQEERLAGAILLLVPLEKVLNQTIEYCEQREAFGYPIIYNQSIHFRLAELATELELYRSLIYRTIKAYSSGQDVTMMASMCKLKAGRLARELNDSCLQFWGGMGFTNEVFVSRMFRDMRLISIGGGTDEMMLNIICKKMGILPPVPKYGAKK